MANMKDILKITVLIVIIGISILMYLFLGILNNPLTSPVNAVYPLFCLPGETDVKISPIISHYGNTTFNVSLYSSTYNGTLYLLVFGNVMTYHVYYNGKPAQEITVNDTIYGIKPGDTNSFYTPAQYPLIEGQFVLYKVPTNTTLIIDVENGTPINTLTVWFVYNYSNNLYRVAYTETT